MSEILTLQDALRRRAAASVLRQTYVFTNGCFDVLHPGHVELLHEARRLGHYLLVAINSDRSVRGLKGAGRPLQDETARAKVVAALQDVDGVIVFDEDTPLELIRKIRPDVLVKGGDYTSDQVVGREEVEGSGGRVVIVPLVPGHSSSSVLRRMKAAAKEAAT
jgi:rfaE bifunctional protein nucleotidyltransferase chain/domain